MATTIVEVQHGDGTDWCSWCDEGIGRNQLVFVLVDAPDYGTDDQPYYLHGSRCVDQFRNREKIREAVRKLRSGMGRRNYGSDVTNLLDLLDKEGLT